MKYILIIIVLMGTITLTNCGNEVISLNTTQENEEPDGTLDSDSDGVTDAEDNCPDIANKDQADLDADGEGDVCDDDIDGDGIPNDKDDDADNDGLPNDVDPCPHSPQNDDPDGDKICGTADICPNDKNNPDTDKDQVCDTSDNCPSTKNADQADSDRDGVGDACDSCLKGGDTDRDSDNICGTGDNCPTTVNPDQANADGDVAGDACETCDDDPAKTEAGLCGCGAVDTDSDRDGTPDCTDVCPQVQADQDNDSDCIVNDNDNCPAVANLDQADADTDGFGDACDNCPDISNPDQADSDQDRHGDVCQMWAKVYGCDNSKEVGNSIQQTEDGGYVVAGSKGISNINDVLLVKLTAEGQLEMDKKYGGSADDAAFSVLQTQDNGYILAGKKKLSQTGFYDAWIIKTDASLESIWDKTYGGTGDDLATSIFITNDGYVFGGTKYNGTNKDLWLVTIDPNGNNPSELPYGGDDNNFMSYVSKTSDGGYILVGGSTNTNNILVIKTDANGVVQHSGIIAEGILYAYSVIETNDHGYIIAGTKEINGIYDAYITKLNNNLTKDWSITHDGGDNKNDSVYSIVQADDHNYVALGVTKRTDEKYDIWLFKVDSGNNHGIIWGKIYGDGGTGKEDKGHSIQKTSDGGYIITGTTESFGGNGGDVIVIKTDTQGNSLFDPVERTVLNNDVCQ